MNRANSPTRPAPRRRSRRRRPVAWGQIATLGGSLSIAVGLAAVSYGHIHAFARDAGAALWEAAVVAATVDGLIVVAIGAIAHARRAGTTPPPMIKVALVIGIFATTGANVHHGLPYGWRGVVLALWVPIAAEMAYQLAMWVGRTAPAPETAAPATAPRICTALLSLATVEASLATPPPVAITGAGAPAFDDTGPAHHLDSVLGQLSDTKRQAVEVLAERPDISGSELGHRVGVTARSGQRYADQLAGLAQRRRQQLRSEVHARDRAVVAAVS